MSKQLAEGIVNQVDSTKEARFKNRSNSYELGMKLLFQTKKDLDNLETEIGSKDDVFKNTADKLASEVMQCGIDYFLSSNDKRSFSENSALEMLNSAKKISENKEIVSRINDNIEGIHDWVKTHEYRFNQNRQYNFDKILLNTAFSFMTCDGHIDKNEIQLIKQMATKDNLFGDVDINEELTDLINGINSMGLEFLKDYFKVLENANFNHEQEVRLVDLALRTMGADGKTHYYELKFFKIFRTMLRLTDAEIRAGWPKIADELLERDIFSHAYLSQLFNDYFAKVELPAFSI